MIFNNHVIADFPQSAPLKEFCLNRTISGEDMDKKLVGTFFMAHGVQNYVEIQNYWKTTRQEAASKLNTTDIIDKQKKLHSKDAGYKKMSK